MFKKTCFLCGAKVDELYDSKCEDCFKEENPPIKELKPINVKYCNSCKRLHYNNLLLSRKEFEERLPLIVKKNLVLNDHYKLNKIEIDDFEIQGENVSFNLEIDAKLKK